MSRIVGRYYQKHQKRIVTIRELLPVIISDDEKDDDEPVPKKQCPNEALEPENETRDPVVVEALKNKIFGRRFYCKEPYCTEVFIENYLLIAHMKKDHLSSCYTCLCGKIYVNSKHYKKIHVKKCPLSMEAAAENTCSICKDMNFKLKASHGFHKEMHLNSQDFQEDLEKIRKLFEAHKMYNAAENVDESPSSAV